MSENQTAFQPLEERPLVTFALFAYNQEEYIREAIEGAFAQTYEPLEIILSDDCSTDRTFSIMKEMADTYDGPHKVVANKTEKNVGTLAHVLDVACISHGSLIVVAAGDDISLPDRALVCRDAWSRTGAWAVTSHFALIDEAGKVIDPNCISEGKNGALWDLFAIPPYDHFIHGATAAYDRRVFDFLSYPNVKIFSEDAILTYLVWALEENVNCLSDVLVQYRRHVGSISNGGTERPEDIATLAVVEAKKEAGRRAWLNLLDYISHLQVELAKNPGVRERVCAVRFDRLRERLDLQCEWAKLSVSQRVLRLARLRNFQAIRWGLPRIFGPRMLYLTRRLGNLFRA